MAMADGAASAVRQINSRDCVLALRDAAAPQTLAEIAGRTGLSRPTVESILRELTASGIVAPAPVASPGPGRPARRFVFDPSSATVAAVDVGTGSVRCLVTDAAGTVLTRADAPAEPGGGLAAIESAVRTTGHAPQSLGLAVPGILTADGRISQSLAVGELVGLDLAGELERRLGCPVVVENDIKLAAYAEHHRRTATSDIVFVEIGHRISVALIVGGRILQGRHRLAGELGIQRGMRWTRSSHRGRLRWSTGDDAEPLFTRAEAGETAALAEIDAFCAEIAPRLATLALTTDPELVVVGGGLSRAGDLLLDPLRRHLDHLLLSTERPAVVGAGLTTDGALLGALGRAFEHGSGHIVGAADVPPPWPRFLSDPSPDRPASHTPDQQGHPS